MKYIILLQMTIQNLQFESIGTPFIKSFKKLTTCFILLLLWYSQNLIYSLDTENGNGNLKTNAISKTFSDTQFGLIKKDTEKINYRLNENTEVRIRLKDLFTAPLVEVLQAPQTIYAQRDGNLPVMFQVRLNNEQENKLYYAFVNRSHDQEDQIIYPVSNRGNYLIRRDIQENRIDQIKIFLNKNIGDQQSFIRIYPPKDKIRNPYSELEVVIFDHIVYSNLALAIPFEEILTMPFSQLIQVSSKVIKWEILLSNPRLKEWELVQQIPDQLRPYLYQIPEVYDGAMDAQGRFVRIETGEPLEIFGFNCSGFIKWVGDGVYRSHKSWSGEALYLDIDQLKRRQTEIRGEGNPWSNAKETARDPYFGLDWARAIAQQLRELESEKPVDSRISDVQNIPFFRYFENVGYPIANINTMMYLLAIQNPGYFYLGAINGNWGNPPLHQYYHEVVFFPYFHPDGTFQLIVMDTGVERKNGFLEETYQNNYVHLSRIRAPHKYQIAPLNRQIFARNPDNETSLQSVFNKISDLQSSIK